MKKLLIVAFTVAALAVGSEAQAYRFFGNSRCNRNQGCAVSSCETPCAAPCEVKAACPTYKVIRHTEEPMTCPPICCRAVEIREPAECIKHTTCRWVCPKSCTERGDVEVSNGGYKVVEADGRVRHISGEEME